LLKFGIQRYVRSAGVPANTDIKTYDVGRFYVATSNTPSSPTTLGELYVTYEIELITPQLSNFIAAQLINEPVGSPFWTQFARVVVSAAGVATLFSEYYNQLMFFIVKQQTVAGRAVLDIAVNPNINKLIKFDFASNQVANIGRPGGSAGPNDGGLEYNQSSGIYSYSIAQGSGGTNSSWITSPSPGLLAADADPSNDILPVYRFSLAPGSTTFLNAYTLQGAPDLVSSPLLPAIPGPAPTLREDFVFNWFAPTLPATYASDNQLTFRG
jgi:hypothetical protein